MTSTAGQGPDCALSYLEPQTPQKETEAEDGQAQAKGHTRARASVLRALRCSAPRKSVGPGAPPESAELGMLPATSAFSAEASRARSSLELEKRK